MTTGIETGVKTIAIRKDDVWLFKIDYAGGMLEPKRVKAVSNGHVYVDSHWYSGADFLKIAVAKIGTVRRIFGIPFGIRREK